jgi:F0F1-type ATP synthase membrane subunit b/b'
MSAEGDQKAQQGGTIAEVDRIRDIIFGPQMHIYEQQFQRVSSQLELLGKQLEELRAHADRQVAQLGTHCEEERGRMQAEARKDSESLRADMTSRTEKLEAKLNAETKQLASDLRAQTQSLRSEFRAALDVLDDDKAGRQNVGDLLIEMGTRLKEQVGITDLLGQLGDLAGTPPQE